MNKKVTFLWVLATLLLATTVQAKDGRPTIMKAPSPVTIPYDADFFASDEVMEDFIIINNNDDTSDGEPCTWKWSSSNGAYYIYNIDGETPADDYLVLPVILEAGKTYDVTVNAAIWNYPEVFEVVAGTECTAAGLTTTIIDKTTPENEPADYSGTFTPTSDGTYYIAIHVTSEPDQYILSVYHFSIDVASNPAAPAVVSDISVEQLPGELKNKVSFTAPTTSIGGDVLTDNLTIEILRNGELAATLTDVAPGSAQSHIDEVPAEGTYRYQIVAYNAAGKGRKSDYVSVKVAMPQDIPYVVNFNDDVEMFDNFLIIDNNNDGSTWGLNYHMTAGTVAAYNYDWDNDGDDYFVTQPLRLEAGKKYDVTIRAAASNTSDPERFEVVAGRKATAEDLNIPVIGRTDVTSEAFADYTGSFTTEESGIYYVAIHAISDANSFYLLVSDLKVELGAEGTAPAAPTLMATAGAEGALSATIQVTAPTLCVNGTTLTSISMIELYRDDELIGQQDDVEPGAVLTFTDEDVPTSALYHYQAVAYNESGIGEKSEKLAIYIGLDEPNAPENIEAKDLWTNILFSWDPVTTGVNGGYVNPDNITYDIWRLDVSPFYVSFEDKLLSVTGQNRAIVEFNTDEGDEQDFTFFAVRTTNESTKDEDYAAWNYTYLFTGKPYDMPMTEGFANNELHYYWESNGLLYTSPYAVDGDNVALRLLTDDVTESVYFMSGKLNLSDCEDPKLVFSAMSPNVSKIDILGDVDGQNTFHLLQSIDLSNQDYQTYQVSLSSLKNHRRYARFYISAEYKKASMIDEEGYISELGDYIFIDGIHIGDFQDNDLALSVNAQESVAAGEKATILVSIENIGLQPASNYTVSVMSGETELFNETFAEELPPFVKNEFPVLLPTSIFDEAIDMDFTVTVDYAADPNTDNNRASGVVSITEPEVAAPENLVATENEGGVDLEWTAPAASAEEYTEDFETGVGDFTQIDGNGDGFGWEYMYSDELLTHSGWGALQSYSYVPSVGGVYVDNWLVTPLAVLDGTFSFWAGAQDGDWTDEHFAVYVSTKGNESVDDFELVSEEFVTTGYTTEYTVDLSSYGGQTGYIAIRHFNSYDQFAMVVDDISFTKAPVVPASFNIYVERELIATVEGETTTYTVEADKLPADGCTLAVTAVYVNGKESRPATVTLASSTDIRQMMTSGKPIDIYTLDGRLLRRQATTLEGLKGVFIINGKAVMLR